MKQDTEGLCSETTLRDGVGREVGSGWADTCVSVADSCQCMAKTITMFSSNYLGINKLKTAVDYFHDSWRMSYI